MVTIRDVAKKSNYSISSVSKALNGYTDISEPTREQIIKVANEIGYTANYHARALKTKCTYSIGIVYTYNSDYGFRNEFFTLIIDSIRKSLEKEGYDILLLNPKVGNIHKSYLEHALYRVVDGVCVVCADPDDRNIIELCKTRKFPVVSIDMRIGHSFGIFSDNYNGMKKLVKYIISQGHRRIAYIHGRESKTTKDRISGYLETMKEHGLNVPDGYLQNGEYLNIELADKKLVNILKLTDKPTCIMMPDDLTAIGAINMLNKMGLKCPEDISIAGYDGIHIGEYTSPSLTTIRQNSTQIGKLTSETILEFIENKGDIPISNKFVEGKLTIGTSVAKIR